VDQSQNPNVETARGPSLAVINLDHDFLAILASEEAARIGRSVAEIPRGDGWREAKASAVLAGAVIGWLSPDAVQTFGFFADENGPLEIVAKVGQFYITGHGIESYDDLTAHCSQRHGTDPGQSHLDEFSTTEPDVRFTMDGARARRATARMAALLGVELDREAVLAVLGA
jgi:hypothetical protein